MKRHTETEKLLKGALLPFYLELYDQSHPGIRPGIDMFLKQVTNRLAEKGISIIELPVCRTRREFDQAINTAEKEEADALITLHLAYSPSLESIEALKNTQLPIIVMDTTPGYNFDPLQSPAEIMYNHGIHGVQDMCNLLIRNNKDFVITAGHMDHSDILDRIKHHMMAAKMASAMKNGRTGQIGHAFAGMGDFVVEPEIMKTSIGSSVIQIDPAGILDFLPGNDEPEIGKEMEKDRNLYDTEQVDPSLHRQSVINGLALRRWIDKENLSAFTINFANVDRKKNLSAVPFLEISKLLAKGIGYAGEGDILTASLTGALFAAFEKVSFVEMFCPDWKNGTLFISHMGEMNLQLVEGKPRLTNMSYNFSDAEDTVVATACYMQGDAVLVNLAPGPDHGYNLIVAPVTMLAEGANSKFSNNIRGWMKPRIPVADFLEEYSKLGATHHAALVYEADPAIILQFGKMMGWQTHLAGINTVTSKS